MICKSEAERRALTRVKCAVLKFSHALDMVSAKMEAFINTLERMKNELRRSK